MAFLISVHKAKIKSCKNKRIMHQQCDVKSPRVGSIIWEQNKKTVWNCWSLLLLIYLAEIPKIWWEMPFFGNFFQFWEIFLPLPWICHWKSPIFYHVTWPRVMWNFTSQTYLITQNYKVNYQFWIFHELCDNRFQIGKKLV